ncbi:hypothetical protein RB195_002617 [Necator americanus]|uniref:Uncharacterized protein n=1 Tax=Necator americanus TaxID=51031 RepID=A0ABR1DK40_NECAM
MFRELENKDPRRKEKRRSRHRRAREERRREEERVKKREEEIEEGEQSRHEDVFVVKDDKKSGRGKQESSKKRLEGEERRDESSSKRSKEDRDDKGKRKRDLDISRRREEGSRRKDDERRSDSESSSRKVRKQHKRDEHAHVRLEERSPPRSPTARKSLPEKSRAQQGKTKKFDSKSSSDFSPSVSRGLVCDLDVSQSTKNRRKRERREKRRRERREHREAHADDRQMFESIRNIMPREDEAAHVKRSDEEKEKHVQGSSAFQHQQPLNGTAKSVYIGVCNFAKAEEQVEKRSDFRVYHQLAHRPLLDDLEQELPLIVVYKTANGSFRHYPIRRRKVGSSSYYYVDYGDPKVQAHASLDHLVRYYQINAQRHPNNRQYADQFPWWEVHL